MGDDWTITNDITLSGNTGYTANNRKAVSEPAPPVVARADSGGAGLERERDEMSITIDELIENFQNSILCGDDEYKRARWELFIAICPPEITAVIEAAKDMIRVWDGDNEDGCR
jgi:hypothetical protein